MPEFKTDITSLFFESTQYGYFKARSKKQSSIQKKMFAERFLVTSFPNASKKITDGLAGRFILESTTPEALEKITQQLIDSIKSGKLKIQEIRAYELENGSKYFSDNQIFRIQEAGKQMGDEPKVLTGPRVRRNTGYVSTHFLIKTDLGITSEIQIRGELINQLSEVSHIFYDIISKKPLSPSLQKDKKIVAIRATLESLNESQRESYGEYLKRSFSYYKSVETSPNTSRGPPPKLPFNLKGYKGITTQAIWKKLGPYFEASTNVSSLSINESLKQSDVFDSIRYISAKFSFEHAKDVIGNVSAGKDTRVLYSDIQEELFKRRMNVEGLDVFGVIPWREADYFKERRKALRKGEVWEDKIPIPKYREGQPLGEAVAHIDDIHYMQSNADNVSGEYTVVGNAKALKAGTLKTSDLPPLEVWRDETGKIWSLDHRRLAAYELSGVVEEVSVTFVSKEKVEEDTFKFSTQSDGESIIIEYKDSPLGLIIKK